MRYRSIVKFDFTMTKVGNVTVGLSGPKRSNRATPPDTKAQAVAVRSAIAAGPLDPVSLPKTKLSILSSFPVARPRGDRANG